MIAADVDKWYCKVLALAVLRHRKLAASAGLGLPFHHAGTGYPTSTGGCVAADPPRRLTQQ